MIKAEWRYLWRHKFLIGVLCVVMLIPSIYAVTFLKSMWNPYGKTGNLPVAVVNHDQAVTYNHQRLTVGKSLTHNLKKSTSLDFHVLKSDQQARDGLKTGQYYMVVTIPKRFSENATTLLSDHPQKMVLHYDTSAGHNYMAEKLTSSAAKQIQASVAKQITQTYAKTLFAAISKLDGGLKTAAQGSQQLTTGTAKLQSGTQSLTTNLAKLATSSLTLANGSQKVTTGLQQYWQAVQTAQSGSQQVTTGLDQLLAQSTLMKTGVATLASGTGQLSSGVTQYVAAANQLSAGTQQLSTGATTFSNNVTTLGQRTQQLQQGTSQLTNGLQQLTTSSEALSTSIQQLATAQSQSTATAQKQVAQLLTQVNALNQNSSQVQAVKQALTQLQTAVQALDQQQTQQQSLADQVSQTADAQHLTADQKQAMVAVVAKNDHTQTDTTAVTSAMTALSSAMSALTTSTNTANLTATVQALAQQQNQAQQALTKLATGADTLSTHLASATQSAQQLNAGTQALSTAMPALTTGAGKLATSSQTLASKTAQYAQSGTTLESGAQQVDDGVAQLSAKLPTLLGGIGKLVTGSQTLTSGLTQLVNKGATLVSGATQVSQGNQQLASGAGQLATGSQTLQSGLSQLLTGTTKLTTKLNQGAKQGHLTTNAETNRQVAAPVKTTHTELDRVPNNGTGMAPYMVSVSLFVGALALNLLFDLYSPRRYPKTAISWMISKASIWVPFAIGDALLVYGLLCGIDGLNPVHHAATLAMMILSSLSSMAIVTWLNLAFGKVGAFLSMVLMVLQLGGSAGTYPIQLSNGFFMALHPFLPMTYSVNGLRNTLMIGASAMPQALVLIGIIMGALVLMFLFYARRHGRLDQIDFQDARAVKATQSKMAARIQRSNDQ